MGERDRQPSVVPASHAQPSKCLLWVSAGCDVPLELLDGLRRRDVTVRQVHDAPSVMATLATERAKVLVLVEPDTLRQLEPLVRAVRSYFDVSIWRYRRGAVPALTPYDAGHEAQPTPVAQSSPVNEPSAPSPQPHTPADTEHDEGVLLSEAELAMLLADDEADLKEADGS